MELPIEKQYQIMSALRRGFSIREISKLFNVPKSTVQNYKKHGPPYFRRLKKILSIEQYPASLQEENEFLKKAIQDVLRQSEQTIDLCNTANKKVADLTVIKSLNEREIERKKQEKEELQTTVNEQQGLLAKKEQEHQKELEKEKAKVEANKNHEIQEIKQDFLTVADGYEAKLATAKNNYNLLTKAHKKTTEENRRLNLENWSFKQKQSNSLLKYTVVYLGGVGTGILAERYVVPALRNIFFPQNVDYGKNTGTPVIPILKEAVIEPDIHYTYSGAIPLTIASSIFWSGTFGALCYSGVCLSTYGNNTSAENAVFSNPQGDMIHPPIYDNNSGINLVTNISSLQSSRTYVSSHLDTIAFTSQVETSVQIPSPFQIPINYYFIPLPLPLPDDLSEVYPMKQLRCLKGIPFEMHMEKLFVGLALISICLGLVVISNSSYV